MAEASRTSFDTQVIPNEYSCPLTGTTLDAMNLQRIQVATVGFHEQPLNLSSELETAWNATMRIFIRPECGGTGTAFLFERDENFAYFLTNLHVVNGERRNAPALSCFYRAHMQASPDAQPLYPDMERTAHFDPATDLLVIRVHLNGPDGEYFRRIEPIRMPTECFERAADDPAPTEQQTFFMIGYPAVSLLGESPNELGRRRWSSGQRIFHLEGARSERMRDFFARQRIDAENFIFANIYSIPGNSGGPVLDRQGHFIGVAGVGDRQAVIIPGYGWQSERWEGPPENLDFAGITRCRRVLEFLRSRPLDSVAPLFGE